MLMTNGIGAVLGNLVAGFLIAKWFEDPITHVKDWSNIWFLFSAYALVVGVTFAFVFKYDYKKELSKEQA